MVIPTYAGNITAKWHVIWIIIYIYIILQIDINVNLHEQLIPIYMLCNASSMSQRQS